MNGTAFNLNSNLAVRNADVFKDVSEYAIGPLNSNTIEAAVYAAHEESNFLYIPPGDYQCKLIFDSDVTLLLDSECKITPRLSTTEVTSVFDKYAAIYASDCSISIYGGQFYSGVNDNSRHFIYEDISVSQGGSIIYLSNCHDIEIQNIYCPWSKHGNVVTIENCTNTNIDSCRIENILLCAIHIFEHCVNTRISNCIIKNVRYSVNRSDVGTYYCYAVCTGLHNLYDEDIVPPDNLIYENNYVDGTEDSGLDTHGATNVIIRNNRVLNTVCAITAYNDARRVRRPEGWRMYNILIENNYCESNKSNDPGTEWPHPYVLLGSPNTADSDEESSDQGSHTSRGRAANYEDYNGCIVRNNIFRSKTSSIVRTSTGKTFTPNLVTFNALSRRCVFENNIVDNLGGDAKPLAINRSHFSRILNNQFLNISSSRANFAPVNSLLEFNNNIGINVGIEKSNPSCIYSSFNGFGYNAYNVGETYVSGGYATSTTNIDNIIFNPYYGIRVNPNGVNSSVLQSFSFTQTSGIAYSEQLKDLLIPGLAVTVTNLSTGTTSNVYVYDLIDFQHFKLQTSTRQDLEDGEYTLIIRKIYPQDFGNILVPASTTTSVDILSEPSSSGAVLATLPVDTKILTNRTTVTDSSTNVVYRLSTVVVNGAFIHGYVRNARLTILDPNYRSAFYQDNSVS